MKSWLKNNDIEINSTHNEGKSVVAERPLSSNTYIAFDFESNNKGAFKIRSLKFKFKVKVGDHVRILKYNNFFLH